MRCCAADAAAISAGGARVPPDRQPGRRHRQRGDQPRPHEQPQPQRWPGAPRSRHRRTSPSGIFLARRSMLPSADRLQGDDNDRFFQDPGAVPPARGRDLPGRQLARAAAEGGIEAVNRTMREEWGQELIRAWNTRGWVSKPRGLGDKIARLIGAPAGTVVVGDTLSIKVYQALAAALALRPDRRVILSDDGNFPTDLYMAQGLIGLLGGRLQPAHAAARGGRGGDRRGRGGGDADRGRLPDRAPARHAAHHPQGPCGGRAGDLGPGAFGRGAAGGRARQRGGLRGRLHVQVPERRAGGAGVHLRRARACRPRPSRAVGLARPRRAVRLRARLPAGAGHRAHARRHAAAARLCGARGGARGLGRRRDARRPGAVDRAVGALHRRGRGALPRPDAREPARPCSGAAARSRSASARATPRCRR